MSDPQGRDAIIQFANHCRAVASSAKQRPVTVARLELADGNTFQGTSSFEREGRVVHPVVQEAYDEVPRYDRSTFHLKCVETDAMSQALFAWESGTGQKITTPQAAREVLKGAKIQTAKLRSEADQEHGANQPPCSSCKWPLAIFEIEHVEG